MIKEQSQSKAQKLLCEYRPTTWRKAALETAPETGRKALQACIEQLRFTQELVEALRSNKLLGEKLYQIIYASYMTINQPYDVGEILDDIAEKYEHIPRSTYFRLKERAIRMMDKYLKEAI